MNLNLPKYNCTYLSLSGECEVSREADSRLQLAMAESHCHLYDDESPRIALFGSKFTTDGLVDKAEGVLHRQRHGDTVIYQLQITNERVTGELPRPPRSYRSVAFLVDAVTGLLPAFRTSCRARFIYDDSDEYRSKVPLPAPLIFPDEGGVTHIEGTEFSRRDNDGVVYKILVTNSEEENALIHIIQFERSIELSRNTIRDLRDTSRKISTRLLYRFSVSQP